MEKQLLRGEEKDYLLARHRALTQLCYFLPGDISRFFDFLNHVCQLEKAIEIEKNSIKWECDLIRALVYDGYSLKRLFFSEEWQTAREYLEIGFAEDTLVDICNLLEIGQIDSELSKTKSLREQLISQAFSGEDHSVVEIRYRDIPIEFVFSDTTSRWSIEKITWHQNNSIIYGKLYISLGNPDYKYSDLYNRVFAITGEKKRAACLIALHGIYSNDIDLQNLSKNILRDLDFELVQLAEIVERFPQNCREDFDKWYQKPLLTREFSEDSVAFLVELLLESKHIDLEIHNYLLARFVKSGLELTEIRNPSGYDFSDEIPEGEVIYSHPAVKYYWPLENKYFTIYSGKCKHCAGQIPLFLKKVEKLREQGILEPRKDDLHAVRQMLLYIKLGGKISKPPILPVYNALRRWFEALNNEKDDEAIEQLCLYAEVFRPHILIPCVGEKLPKMDNIRHKVIYQKTQEKEPNTIIAIHQSSIVIPSSTLPLCLPGHYVIASEKSTWEDFLNVFSEMSCVEGLQSGIDWESSETLDNVLSVINEILEDVPALSEKQWGVLCQLIDELNIETKSSVHFLDKRKISFDKYLVLEKQKGLAFSLLHDDRTPEGTIISQKCGLKNLEVRISSGIPQKISDHIVDLNHKHPLIPNIGTMFVSELRKRQEQIQKSLDEIKLKNNTDQNLQEIITYIEDFLQ